MAAVTESLLEYMLTNVESVVCSKHGIFVAQRLALKFVHTAGSKLVEFSTDIDQLKSVCMHHIGHRYAVWLLERLHDEHREVLIDRIVMDARNFANHKNAKFVMMTLLKTLCGTGQVEFVNSLLCAGKLNQHGAKVKSVIDL